MPWFCAVGPLQPELRETQYFVVQSVSSCSSSLSHDPNKKRKQPKAFHLMIMARVVKIHEVRMPFIKDNHWGMDEMGSAIWKHL